MAIGIAALLIIPEAMTVTDYNWALGSIKGSKSLSTSFKFIKVKEVKYFKAIEVIKDIQIKVKPLAT